MRRENERRNIVQGVNVTSADVETEALGEGPQSPAFRYMY